MATLIESAIASYTSNRSDTALRALDLAIVQDEVLVPVSSEAETETGHLEIPVICLKTTAGDGAIPAFTTIDQLFKWRPEGCKYVTLTGRALLEMATTMPKISRIVINVDGSPRGAIPRSEFARLIELG